MKQFTAVKRSGLGLNKKFFGPSGLSLVYKQGGPEAQGPSPGSAITFCYKVFLLIENVPNKWISLDPLLREDRMLLMKMPLWPFLKEATLQLP